VVSDLAGTLIADAGVVARVYETVLTRFGIPFTGDDLSRARGASKRAAITTLVRRCTPPDRVEALSSEILDEFNADALEGLTDAPEIDGVSEAITALRSNGIRLALTTGFARPVAERIIARHPWHADIDLLITAEDVRSGRPMPYMVFHAMHTLGVRAVANVAVIGDTVLDLQSGTNAGARWVIGVLSGAHPVALLGATRHTHLLGTFADLPLLLTRA
jgi:phosphonatase-like hydrolase